jgi:CDGSH-type Zn-finger protein
MAKIEIKASNNGPYVITGRATYTNAYGNEQATAGKAIALCRCGQSSNKPFCDGTHRKIGFQAVEVVLHVDQ